MRTNRISALGEGDPFITVDAAGVAHLFRVRRPAWTGIGEGNQVTARPEPIRDPAHIGLGIRQVGELAIGDLCLLPETDGWRLFRVQDKGDEFGGMVELVQLLRGMEQGMTAWVRATEPVYARRRVTVEHVEAMPIITDLQPLAEQLSEACQRLRDSKA